MVLSKTLNCSGSRAGGLHPKNCGRPDPRTGGRPNPRTGGRPSHASVLQCDVPQAEARGRPTPELGAQTPPHRAASNAAGPIRVCTRGLSAGRQACWASAVALGCTQAQAVAMTPRPEGSSFPGDRTRQPTGSVSGGKCNRRHPLVAEVAVRVLLVLVAPGVVAPAALLLVTNGRPALGPGCGFRRRI